MLGPSVTLIMAIFIILGWYAARPEELYTFDRKPRLSTSDPDHNLDWGDDIPDAKAIVGLILGHDFRMDRRHFVSLFDQNRDYKIYRVDAINGMTRRVILTDATDKILDVKDVQETHRALVSGSVDCKFQNAPQAGIYALAEVGRYSAPAHMWKIENRKFVDANIPGAQCGVIEQAEPVSSEEIKQKPKQALMKTPSRRHTHRKHLLKIQPDVIVAAAHPEQADSDGLLAYSSQTSHP